MDWCRNQYFTRTDISQEESLCTHFLWSARFDRRSDVRLSLSHSRSEPSTCLVQNSARFNIFVLRFLSPIHVHKQVRMDSLSISSRAMYVCMYSLLCSALCRSQGEMRMRNITNSPTNGTCLLYNFTAQLGSHAHCVFECALVI